MQTYEYFLASSPLRKPVDHERRSLQATCGNLFATTQTRGLRVRDFRAHDRVNTRGLEGSGDKGAQSIHERNRNNADDAAMAVALITRPNQGWSVAHLVCLLTPDHLAIRFDRSQLYQQLNQSRLLWQSERFGRYGRRSALVRLLIAPPVPPTSCCTSSSTDAAAIHRAYLHAASSCLRHRRQIVCYLFLTSTPADGPLSCNRWNAGAGKRYPDPLPRRWESDFAHASRAAVGSCSAWSMDPTGDREEWILDRSRTAAQNCTESHGG